MSFRSLALAGFFTRICRRLWRTVPCGGPSGPRSPVVRTCGEPRRSGSATRNRWLRVSSRTILV